MFSLTTPILQIDVDIDQFVDISVVDLAAQAHKKFDAHYNLGHYVIKENRVYSKMIGGFLQDILTTTTVTAVLSTFVKCIPLCFL